MEQLINLKHKCKKYSSPLLNGWDEVPEHEMYYAWHHEGRRFRHGAEMMGADFTQWHGIWELQEDMIEMITWAAEHGDSEAKQWVNSNHPSKFIPFALYDIPGNAWGINTHLNKTPFVYNNYPDYWDRIYKNVEYAVKKGLLTEEQWQLWLKRYNNKEHYIGTKYENDSLWNFYKERNDKDLKSMKEQVVNYKLPGESYWKP